MTTTNEPVPPRRNTIERLYVLWLVSSALLLLIVIAVAMLGNERLKRHAARLDEQSETLERLERKTAELRLDLERLIAAPVTPPIASPPADEIPAVSPTVDADARATDADEPDPILDIESLLARAVAEDESGRPIIADADAAESAVNAGMGGAGSSVWSGQTWTRLAIVARLLDRDTPAELFAIKALASGYAPADYYALTARVLLEKGNAPEAIVYAERLVKATPAEASAALLLSEVYHARDDIAGVAKIVRTISDPRVLTASEQLRLGRLLVVTEQWDQLENLVAGFADLPEQNLPRANRLRAVAAIRARRLPEALAIIDALLDDHPNDYDLLTWRGVALLEARQYEAARAALNHADAHPERPEAWCWRGVVELRSGDLDAAAKYIRRSLAASRRYAPAWEALARVALNRGDLQTAAQNAAHAIEANPYRASAHVLLAIASARMERAEPTLDALRAAIKLDPTALQTARDTDAIQRLLSREQWEELARSAE